MIRKLLTLMLTGVLFVTTAANVRAGDNLIYEEAFNVDNLIAKSAGDAKLVVNEDGLHVSNRSLDWHGIDYFFSDINLAGFNRYRVEVEVEVTEHVDEAMQLILQPLGEEYGPWLLNPSFTEVNGTVFEGEFDINDSFDRIRILTNNEAKDISFTLKQFKVYGVEKEEIPFEPGIEFNKITFENGELNGFEPRGGVELLTITDEDNHTEQGNYALKVENRSQNWHGPMLRVEDYVDVGSEYEVSAWVKLLSPDSANLQLSTQIGSEDYGASYNNLDSKVISKGDGWVKLEAKYRYSAKADNFISIYIESKDHASASFLIDDIDIQKVDSEEMDIEKDLVPIKDAYKDYFLIGNAVSSKDFEGKRLELLKHHHNLVTAENAMKPEYAYDDDGNFDFTAEDILMQMAKDAGMKVHGHVLVWHQQSPSFLYEDENGKPLSREAALNNLRTHIKTVVEHFGEDVISWDVVNEAMNDNPPNPEDWKGSLRRSGWFEAIGPDFIKESFIAAKEVIDDNGWDIPLYYNDYNDDNQNKSDAIYYMVKEINEEYAKENNGELLIDGIGMQGHYNMHTRPENVEASLKKFISLGVEVGVTELDVTAGENNVLTETQAKQQAYLYARLFKIYKEHSEHISRVTFWGLDDGASWRASQSPLLFDRNLQAKPTYYAILDPETYIENYDEDVVEARTGFANYGTPNMNSEMIDDIWRDVPTLKIDKAQQAWDVAQGVAKVMWDERNLYVLVEVSDSVLDKSSSNAHEQDSVEVFVDEKNLKSIQYQEGIGQYRVNYANEASFNPGSISEGFESRTIVHDEESGYTVEMKIPFKFVDPLNEMKIGFDVQINDAKDGVRQGVSIWNDVSGQGYQDASVFGNLVLVGKEDIDEIPIDDNDVDETPIDDNDMDDVGEDQKVIEEKDKVEGDLPTTGESLFNLRNIGLTLSIIGIALLIRRKKLI